MLFSAFWRHVLTMSELPEPPAWRNWVHKVLFVMRMTCSAQDPVPTAACWWWTSACVPRQLPAPSHTHHNWGRQHLSGAAAGVHGVSLTLRSDRAFLSLFNQCFYINSPPPPPPPKSMAFSITKCFLPAQEVFSLGSVELVPLRQHSG